MVVAVSSEWVIFVGYFSSSPMVEDSLLMDSSRVNSLMVDSSTLLSLSFGLEVDEVCALENEVGGL